MVMTSDQFINIYWSQYISIEKEFTTSVQYLSIDEINNESYSQAYSKLMLQIGSEIDVVFKEYCQVIDNNFKKSYKSIDRYRNCVLACEPAFVTQEIEIKNYGRIIKPWFDWSIRPDKAPFWWTAYNAVKHNRTGIEEIDGERLEGYKFANQKYTLLALGGLYQIMVYYYHKIATNESKWVVTPMPGSRLFELTGGIWADIVFYGDSAFHIDPNTGHLLWKTSSIHY